MVGSIKTAFKDSQITLYQGDCREVLAELPERSVQSVISSPPYWGLRDYQLPPSVWGGDEGCEHDWREERSSLKTGRNDEGMRWADQYLDPKWKHNSPGSPSTGSLCRYCGAWRGCHGLEPTPDLWVANEITIFRALRRVLRDDGTIWWNVGDSYSGGGRARGKDRDGIYGPSKQGTNKGTNFLAAAPTVEGVAPGNLMQMPDRLALALQGDGWILRSKIIWAKGSSFEDKSGSVMPESVSGWRWERHRVSVGKKRKAPQGAPAGWRSDSNPDRLGRSDAGELIAALADCPGCAKCRENDGLVLRKGSWRPTSSYEVILLLAKTADYFCDGEAVREMHTFGSWSAQGDLEGRTLRGQDKDGHQKYGDSLEGARPTFGPQNYNPAGRNLRNVWRINTAPYPDAHFATFPPKLIEPLVKASTPEKGSCGRCGAPWVRVVEHTKLRDLAVGLDNPLPKKRARERMGLASKVSALSASNSHNASTPQAPVTTTLAHRPSCGCGVESVPATVLDPFAGSGTTLEVARSLGCNAIGIELSKEYTKLAAKRLAQGVLSFGGNGGG